MLCNSALIAHGTLVDWALTGCGGYPLASERRTWAALPENVRELHGDHQKNFWKWKIQVLEIARIPPLGMSVVAMLAATPISIQKQLPTLPLESKPSASARKPTIPSFDESPNQEESRGKQGALGVTHAFPAVAARTRESASIAPSVLAGGNRASTMSGTVLR